MFGRITPDTALAEGLFTCEGNVGLAAQFGPRFKADEDSQSYAGRQSRPWKVALAWRSNPLRPWLCLAE